MNFQLSTNTISSHTDTTLFIWKAWLQAYALAPGVFPFLFSSAHLVEFSVPSTDLHDAGGDNPSN